MQQLILIVLALSQFNALFLDHSSLHISIQRVIRNNTPSSVFAMVTE